MALVKIPAWAWLLGGAGFFYWLSKSANNAGQSAGTSYSDAATAETVPGS
jgi:hypothetical protein